MRTRKVVFREDAAHLNDDRDYPGMTSEMKHLFDGKTVREVYDLGESRNHGYFYECDCWGSSHDIDGKVRTGWWINPGWVDEWNFKDIEELFEI